MAGRWFLAAARTLANFTRSNDASDNCLYPRLRELRAVSKLIAFKVAQTARDEGCGRSLDDAELQAAIEEFVWFPDYPAKPATPVPAQPTPVLEPAAAL